MAAQHALVTLGSLMKMLLRQLLTTVTSYLLTNHICLIFSCSIRLQKIKSLFLACFSDIIAAAVLSGNRNFEGRIHALVRANYLASPPLVVAYALAGTVSSDLPDWFLFFLVPPPKDKLLYFAPQYVCICIRLILILRRNQLGKEEMEMMCTSRTYGHQTKKLQR